MLRIVSSKCIINLGEIDFMVWEGDYIPTFDPMPIIEPDLDMAKAVLQILFKSGAIVTLCGLDAMLVWYKKLEYEFYSNGVKTESLEEEYQAELTQRQSEQQSTKWQAAGLCAYCGHALHPCEKGQPHNPCLVPGCNCGSETDDIPF